MVGDQLTLDIACANAAKVHGIWANIIPGALDKSIAAINDNQFKADSAIYSLCQLPSVVDTLH